MNAVFLSFCAPLAVGVLLAMLGVQLRINWMAVTTLAAHAERIAMLERAVASSGLCTGAAGVFHTSTARGGG